jgi:two-component system response regulator GlrR
VIAATHRDLRQLVTEGRFREDLFYRLQVLPLHTPPLRSRRGDVGYLANAFAMRFATEHGRKVEGFTSGAMKALLAHSWPGNVRELQNRVEHGLVMGKGALITAADLFPETSSLPPTDEVADSDDFSDLGDEAVKPYKEAKERFEKQYISALLRHAKGNIAAAARIAGKYRTEVYGLIKKYQIDPREFKQN